MKKWIELKDEMEEIEKELNNINEKEMKIMEDEEF